MAEAGTLSAARRNEIEKLLGEVGRRHGCAIHLARIVGRRWSFLAGDTDSEAGLLGVRRIELPGGYGLLVFGAEGSPAEDGIQDVRSRIVTWLRQQGMCEDG